MINKPPNILLITIDALRADMLGCYGGSGNLTPNIDRLAKNGVRFVNAITAGSWTQAAFPAILTSTYPSWYGGCLGPLAAERPSPVEALANEGYTTVAFSTNPHLSVKSGYGRGFHSFHDLAPAERDPWLKYARGGLRVLYSPVTHRLANVIGWRTRPARLYVSAEELTNRVLDELGSLSGPFFLWAHYMDVHWPNHLTDTLTQPEDIAQAWRDLTHLNRLNKKGVPVTPQKIEHFTKLYSAALKYTDAQIGRLLDGLSSFDLSENTVVFLLSDHGEEFFDRKRWGHVEVNLFDEILRVPFIVAGPGVLAGEVVTSQIQTLDVMPTILDFCQTQAPDGLCGTSVAPFLKDVENQPVQRLSISERPRREHYMVAVRTEQWKYIWDSKNPGRPSLFDLTTDPGERVNVIEQNQDLAKAFQSSIDEHRRLGEATLPAHEPEKLELDHVVIQRLRDLGYVE
jgi:arylsulfatase A-like enzyme